jgi:hypothetical protein
VGNGPTLIGNQVHLLPHTNNLVNKFAEMQQNNERFSYTKFGNITIDMQKNKNRPLYSHEIP